MGGCSPGYWSPDGNRLSVVEWADPSSKHVVYVVSPTGQPAVRLTPPDAVGTFALGPWLPDGSGFLVRSNVGRDFAGLAGMDATTGELSCWTLRIGTSSTSRCRRMAGSWRGSSTSTGSRCCGSATPNQA
jgi:hypothetical protein